MLLGDLYELYGWDFRSYAQASLRRRIGVHLKTTGLEDIHALRESVRKDPDAMAALLRSLTVHVSAMFRDPEFFLTFRTKIAPMLSTYPYLRLWVAGSSTGEELYSLAIVLQETGLYERSRIYATDINDAVLDRARAGVYPIGPMQDYTRNYHASGGQRPFGEYYTADSEYAVFNPALRKNVVFAAHNLATDASFNEFHVIFCRNVMIYFNKTLQERVHRLFYDSLLALGYLGLGRSESIRFSPHEADYEPVEAARRLYRKLQ
ncbi:MAG TPA: protein-glutamate O-methyltransferase CheR [Opitutaceae bacterium]|nr:protein-glutamate O-methyltransferase CheR [Opitutaceae bacterium]